MTLHIKKEYVFKVGTEETLKRQLDEEKRKGERLNQKLLKAEADNARMSKIMGCVKQDYSSTMPSLYLIVTVTDCHLNRLCTF